MKLLPDSRRFLGSLGLLLFLNLVIKPVWVFGIDRQVQNITGYETYGHYFALLGLTLVFQFLLDLGITPYFNRSVSVSAEQGPVLFSQALGIKLLLGFLYAIVIIMVAWATGVLNTHLLVLLILVQIVSSFLALLRSYLSASQKFTQDAWVSVMDKVFVILVAGFMILNPGLSGSISINQFVIIQGSGLILSVFLAIFFLYQHNVAITIQPLRHFNIGMLKYSMPFAMNIFFMTALMRADGFMVERLAPNGAYAAGTYATVFRLTDSVNMVGFLMAGFLLPFIARSWPNKEKISEVLRLCRIFLVIPAILLAVAAPAISEPLNQLLYHGREAQTSEVIDILFWCLPAFAIIQVHGTLMTASGNINTFVKLSGVFAVLNILLNFLVIPRYGAPGAAWVAVLTQNGFAVLLYMLSVRRTGISISGKEAAFYIVTGISVFLVAKYLFL